MNYKTLMLGILTLALVTITQILQASVLADISDESVLQELYKDYLTLKYYPSRYRVQALQNTEKYNQEVHQYFQLVKAGVIKIPETQYAFYCDIHSHDANYCHTVNPVFLNALKLLPPKDFSDVERMIKAFSSGYYKKYPSAETLIDLTKAIKYGTPVQQGLFASSYGYWGKNLIINLVQLTAYASGHFLSEKHYRAQFIRSTYKAGASPVILVDDSHVFEAVLNTPELNNGLKSYFNSIYSEIKNITPIGAVLGCSPYNNNVAKQIKVLEYCKTSQSLQSFVDENKPLKEHISLQVSSTQEILLKPTVYSKTFEDEKGFDGRNSLTYLLKNIIHDRLDGAMYLIVFQGSDKYQFFTIGVLGNYLNLSLVILDETPAPVLNFSIPLENIENDQTDLVNGIHLMLNQDKENPRNLVPDLQGVWLMMGKD